MFIEEAYEEWAIQQIQNLNLFKKVERVGIHEITPENVMQYVNMAPAVLLEISDDTAIKNLDNLGTHQHLEYTVKIHILTNGMWKKSVVSDNANSLHRAIKNLFRGNIYTSSTESNAWHDYQGRTVLKMPESTLIIQEQRWKVHTKDSPL